MSAAAEPTFNETLAGNISDVWDGKDEPIETEPTTTEPTTTEPTTTEPTTTGEPTATPAAPSFPTAEQIAASVREGIAAGQRPAAPRQYSPEELDQLFNVWKPSPQLISDIAEGGDKALAAFVALRDGLSKQFGTLLQYQLELAKRELSSGFDPALKFVADQSAKADREDFFSQNEDLKDHEQLTEMVFKALKTEGYSAPDKATAFKTLADRTRALLPTTAGGSASTPSGGGRTAKQTTGKRPASLSHGSQAGGGGPSATPVPFPGADVYM